MRSRTYIRILLGTLIVSVSFIFFAYSRKTSVTIQKDPDCGGKLNEKCGEKKAQTEFILWESISRNLLSINR
jgi:hypothetical protein